MHKAHRIQRSGSGIISQSIAVALSAAAYPVHSHSYGTLDCTMRGTTADRESDPAEENPFSAMYLRYRPQHSTHVLLLHAGSCSERRSLQLRGLHAANAKLGSLWSNRGRF